MTTNAGGIKIDKVTGEMDMNSHGLHSLDDPVSAQDAATKNYVDAEISSADYEGAFTTTDATNNVLQSIALTDNAITRIVVVVVARDTTSNWYKYKYSQEYTRSSAGNATLLDGGEVATVKNNISGFTGASVNLPGTASIELKLAGSASVHTRGYFKIFVDTIPLAVAT